MCLNHLTMKGYPLTVVTPGNKPPEILSTLSSLKPADTFSQTIIFGYPPFVKGVIDAAGQAGFEWKPLNLGLVVAGECYTEAWRQLVSQRACIREPGRRVVSLYGTADAVCPRDPPTQLELCAVSSALQLGTLGYKCSRFVMTIFCMSDRRSPPGLCCQPELRYLALDVEAPVDDDELILYNRL